MPVRKEGRVIGPGCSFIVAPHWHFSLSIVSSLRFPFAPNPARTREDFSLKQTQRSIQPRLRAIGPQSGPSSSRRRPNKDGQRANMVKTRVAVALIGYRAGYVTRTPFRYLPAAHEKNPCMLPDRRPRPPIATTGKALACAAASFAAGMILDGAEDL
jgi:hypothetical protein